MVCHLSQKPKCYRPRSGRNERRNQKKKKCFCGWHIHVIECERASNSKWTNEWMNKQNKSEYFIFLVRFLFLDFEPSAMYNLHVYKCTLYMHILFHWHCSFGRFAFLFFIYILLLFVFGHFHWSWKVYRCVFVWAGIFDYFSYLDFRDTWQVFIHAPFLLLFFFFADHLNRRTIHFTLIFKMCDEYRIKWKLEIHLKCTCNEFSYSIILISAFIEINCIEKTMQKKVK